MLGYILPSLSLSLLHDVDDDDDEAAFLRGEGDRDFDRAGDLFSGVRLFDLHKKHVSLVKISQYFHQYYCKCS